MGSSSLENCPQNGTVDRDVRTNRPEFYPCADCGRKFTILAMDLHKRSCTETDDCVCSVCKSSVKRIKLEFNIKNEKNFVNVNFESSEKTNKPRFRDIRPGKVRSKDVYANESKNIISFKLLDENSGVINKMVGDNYVNKTTAFNDHKYMSPSSKSSENTTDSDGSASESLSSKFSQFSLLPERSEDHDGEPCNRKLYCTICGEHIFWECFGIHVIEHSKIMENNYLKCPECDKSYSKPALLLIHFYTHVSCHPLDCDECRCGNPNCVDATSSSITEHCYAESVPFHCYICLNRFSHGQTIVNHMRLHSQEMPFTCTECNRSFRQIGNLQRHMATHRGDRPHKCSKCSRSFADPATLRNHVRIHTGETPFVCSICNRGFSQIGNLKRHIALHLQKDKSSTSLSSTIEMIADENTISIVNPPKDIKINPNLSKPLENATLVENYIAKDFFPNHSIKPLDTDFAKERKYFLKAKKNRRKNEKMKVFTCKICKKVYTWQHDLAIHFRTHTGEKPYKCEICDKRFAQSGAVRIHKIRHHNNSAIGRSRWKKK